MQSFTEKNANRKWTLGLFLIIMGIIFLFLGGLGLINFIPASVELGAGIKIVNSSPGLIMTIIGYLLIKNIKGEKEFVHPNGSKEKIISFKKKR